VKAWQGPSLIDGREVMLCLSGLKYPLRSKKLGDMVQASVMPVDEPPQVAVKSGLDAAVCGDCSRRFSVKGAEPEVLGPQPGELVCPGSCLNCGVCWPRWPGGRNVNVYVEEHGTPGRCYVLPWTAPKRIWETYVGQPQDLEAARDAVLGQVRSVRLTAYGDPTAVPLGVWHYLVPDAYRSRRGPAYTRNWRESIEWQGWALASVESLAEAEEAQAVGWRTYRIGGRA
jgi:hypothetical protein